MVPVVDQTSRALREFEQVGGGEKGQQHTMALGCDITNEEVTQGGLGSG